MNNYIFLDFFTDNPWIFILIGVALVLIAVIIILLFVFRGKKKPQRIEVDDEFINNLLELLGTKDNINQINVDNGRLKISVNDLDKVNLEGIKVIATSGVFVTGNIIKTLFRLDSEIIKNALNKRL